MPLTPEQMSRYHRNIIIPEIGNEGQEKLLNSSVIVIGCGGLGSASLIYLCAMGIGKIGICDPDKVDISNLQRQVIHGDVDLGKLKCVSACESLERLNCKAEINKLELAIDEGNAAELFSNYDIIIDACDNLKTRYILNNAAIKTRKPVIFGAVKEFYGQVTTVIPGVSPCYECIFPKNQAERIPAGPPGVLATTAGIIGMIQATEAVKIIIGKGKPLCGRLLIYDGLQMRFSEVEFSVNKECMRCGGDFYEL